MNIQINSLSSALMLGTTLYRNQRGISNKLPAQAGYALIAIVALVETTVALIFAAASLPLCCYSSESFNRATTWLSSSAFSFGWSLVDFVMNLLVLKIVADEQSARKILQQGDLMFLPKGAIL